MKRFLFGFVLIIMFLVLVFTSSKILDAKKYKIRFNSNGGSIVNSILVKENTTIDKLPSPSKKNYEFVGWYLDDELFDFNTKITQNYNLEAKWKLMEAKKYTISFDSIEGSKIDDITLEEGTTLDNLPIPTKEGYKFLYWLYQNKELKELKVNKDMILIAKWQKIID